MRLLRWASLLMILLVLLCQTIVSAAVVPVSPEQPVSIINDQNTVNNIKALQNVVYDFPVSPVSPDDKVVLTATTDQSEVKLAFRNIEDGSVIPVAKEGFLPPRLTELVWRDNSTVEYVSSSGRIPLLVMISRDTAKIETLPLNIPGAPFSLSPDGTRLLVANRPVDSGTGNLSADEKPFKYAIRRSFGKITNPFFSDPTNPAGKSFSGITDIQVASEKINLSSINLNTGEETQLFPLPAGSAPFSISWSPDSSKLALVRTLLPVTGQDNNLLSDLPTQDALGNLNPSDNPFYQQNVIDLIDFKTNQVSPDFLKAPESGNDLFQDLAWSTNNNTLLVRMSSPGHISGRTNPTYLFPERSYYRFYSSEGQLLNTLEKSELDAPNTASFAFISPSEVMINAPHGTDSRLYYFNRLTGEFRALPTEAGSVSVFQPAHQTRQVIFSFSSFLHAPEIYRMGWDGTGLSQLTFENSTLEKNFPVRADPVSFTLSGGQQRTGYIIQAAGASFPPIDQPLVMWQQGGPSAPYLNSWASNVESPFNLLPQFGMAVLFIPLPGREGFGPAFFNSLADDNNFGKIDIDEGAEIMGQAISRGYTSAGKTGVTGCSYGGYFTSQSITRHPEVYSAANSQCSLLDLFNEWQFGFTSTVSYLIGKSPTVDPENYVTDSPLYNAAKAQTPLLLFHGRLDFLPVKLAINFQDQLAADGRGVNIMVFNEEAHGIRDPSDQLIAAQAQIEWFQKYLGINSANSQ